MGGGTGDGGDGPQLVHHEVAAALEFLPHALHLHGAIPQGHDAGLLDEGCGIARVVGLDLGAGGDDLLGSSGIAQAPTGHGVGLGEPIHHHCQLLDLLSQGGDGDEARPIVYELFVDLVGDDKDLLPDAHLRDSFQLLARIERPGWVTGGVQDEGLGVGGHRIGEIPGSKPEPVFFVGGHENRVSPRELHLIGVRNPAGGGDQHVVPRVVKDLGQVEEVRLRAGGDDDLVRGVSEAVVALELVANGLLQIGDAVVGRVFREIGVEGGLGGALDGVGGGEVRLPHGEVHEVDALGPHLERFGADAERGRECNSIHPFSKHGDASNENHQGAKAPR